jgi:hypothetical protein
MKLWIFGFSCTRGETLGEPFMDYCFSPPRGLLEEMLARTVIPAREEAGDKQLAD